MSDHIPISDAARAAFDHVNRDNWTMLAVKPDKTPLGLWGQVGNDNRFDYRNGEDIFSRFAHVDAFGVVTGASGLIIIDLDNEDAIRLFFDRFGVPQTRIVKTPRGRHLYYLAPTDITIGPMTDVLPGIDVRAGNSYAILPPSRTAGGEYSWANDLPIAPLPDDLRALLHTETVKGPTRFELEAGERIKEGARNDTLYHYALKLFRAGFDADTVYGLICALAEQRADGTITDKELIGIVESAEARHLKTKKTDETDDEKPTSLIRTISFADMPAPEAVDWVRGEHLNGRFPLGELTMLYGDPGVGKGTITVALIAEITNAGGTVIISSPEDDPIRVIKPRLIAAGVNLNRCHTIDSVRDYGAQAIDLHLEHQKIIERAIHHGADVIILDPISEHLAADVKNERDNRDALGPYLQACREHRIATIAVGHTNRTAGGSGYMRAGGSSALYKIARSAFIVGHIPAPAEDGEARKDVALAHGKTNLGKKMPTLVYRINTEELAVDENGRPIYTSRATLIGESNLDAEEILDERKITDHARISECAGWLDEHLQEHLGASAKNETDSAAREANSEWTPPVVKRALAAIGGKMKRTGFGGGFVYQSADYVSPDDL
jgi:energy-coupling factor transporter ATP-binding protein EcfA2